MKIIKNGREYNSGKATCFNCGSELEYEKHDISIRDMVYSCDYDGNYIYESCKVITCPVCNHSVCLGIA